MRGQNLLISIRGRKRTGKGLGLKEKKHWYVSAAVLMTIVLGSALSSTAAFAWFGNDEENEGCKHHKYGEICDKTNKDITCNIVSPANHAKFHLGEARWIGVDFTIQASDPGDGIKRVLVHFTHDNTSTKAAVLGGDGLYHVVWTTVGKGDHDVRVLCTDFASNTAHDSMEIKVKE